MDFFSPEGTDSLVRNLNRTSQRVAEQLQIGGLDMRPIRDSMPSLAQVLSLTAGPDNIVNNFLRSKGMHFDSLSVKTSTIEPKPLRMILRIDRFSSGGIVFGYDHDGNMAERLRSELSPETGQQSGQHG